jgi:hypothetical protein
MNGSPDFKLPKGISESIDQEGGGVTVQQLDALVK